jgi:hypothetical protein
MRYVTYGLDWNNGIGTQPYVLWDATGGAMLQGGAAVQNNVYFGYCTGPDDQVTAQIAACAARFLMVELTQAQALAWFTSLYAGSTYQDDNGVTQSFNSVSADANGFIVPSYTAWGTLTVAQLQAQAILQLKSDCDACILKQYPQTNQMALLLLMLQAQQAGNTAANYVLQVWGWASQIMTAYYTYAAQIAACTDQASVLAISWSAALAAIVAQDPGVTLIQAQQMLTPPSSTP